ncbi:MAG TPA: DUF5678 domain-containing protein [Thermoplasmata archaeon]|nr:DUF5678 domain-containing protein [Thermoplasmata archaeon]
MDRDSSYYDLKWLSGRDLTKYQGKWIVVRNRRILAADKDVEKAIRRAKLPPDVIPYVHRVPKEPHLHLHLVGIRVRAPPPA